MFDAFHRFTEPIELIYLNEVWLASSATVAVAGAGVVAITCGGDGPFSIITCGGGVVGGVPTAAGGAFLFTEGLSFFANVTLPAIKDLGCHE
jgi:hypothetical protein